MRHDARDGGPGLWISGQPIGDGVWYRADDSDQSAEVTPHGIETCLCGESGSYNTYAKVHIPFATVAEMMRSAGWTVEPPK